MQLGMSTVQVVIPATHICDFLDFQAVMPFLAKLMETAEPTTKGVSTQSLRETRDQV